MQVASKSHSAFGAFGGLWVATPQYRPEDTYSCLRPVPILSLIEPPMRNSQMALRSFHMRRF